MRKIQSALISEEIDRIDEKLSNLTIPELRAVIRKFVPSGAQEGTPEGDVAKILLQVLDMFEESGPLVFIVQLKDGTRKTVKVKANPMWSPSLLGLFRRVISISYPKYLADRDPIGRNAFALAGRVKSEGRKKRSFAEI